MVSALIVLAVTNKELTRSCPAAHLSFLQGQTLHTLILLYDDGVTKHEERIDGVL